MKNQIKVKDVKRTIAYTLVAMGTYNSRCKVYNGHLVKVVDSELVEGKRVFTVALQNWDESMLNKGICQFVSATVENLSIAEIKNQSDRSSLANSFLTKRGNRMKTNYISIQFAQAHDAELLIAAKFCGMDENRKLAPLLGCGALLGTERLAVIAFIRTCGYNSLQVNAKKRTTDPFAMVEAKNCLPLKDKLASRPDVDLAIAYIDNLFGGTSALVQKPLVCTDKEIKFQILNLERTISAGVIYMTKTIGAAVGVKNVYNLLPNSETFTWNYDGKKIVLAWIPLTYTFTLSLIQE